MPERPEYEAHPRAFSVSPAPKIAMAPQIHQRQAWELPSTRKRQFLTSKPKYYNVAFEWQRSWAHLSKPFY
jgi:hypothetical protein